MCKFFKDNLITLFQRKGCTIISVVLTVQVRAVRTLAKLSVDVENLMTQNTLMEGLISSKLAHAKATCVTLKI